jgi:hypothetical protein
MVGIQIPIERCFHSELSGAEWFMRGERNGLQPQFRGVECKIPFLFLCLGRQ